MGYASCWLKSRPNTHYDATTGEASAASALRGLDKVAHAQPSLRSRAELSRPVHPGTDSGGLAAGGSGDFECTCGRRKHPIRVVPSLEAAQPLGVEAVAENGAVVFVRPEEICMSTGEGVRAELFR
jgi:hypothetical protein